VLEQSRQDWGAIVVDDNSRENSAGFVELLLNRWPDRFTLVRPRLRRGSLANTVLAIRHLCGNPDSVIVTLDADDALLGPSVLDRVAAEYAKGADVTVGSMLRTDKNKQYIPYFHQPRAKRGGNVWQHLRTFKKSLFDQIPNSELLLNGRYVEVASDWAFMLPIVEMARQPVYIPTPLYLYEPSDPSKERRAMRRLPEIEHLATRPARTPAFGAPAEPRPRLEPTT
jgi:glycosyltransferase involved in cell wall biosynthesis